MSNFEGGIYVTFEFVLVLVNITAEMPTLIHIMYIPTFNVQIPAK